MLTPDPEQYPQLELLRPRAHSALQICAVLLYIFILVSFAIFYFIIVVNSSHPVAILLPLLIFISIITPLSINASHLVNKLGITLGTTFKVQSIWQEIANKTNFTYKTTQKSHKLLGTSENIAIKIELIELQYIEFSAKLKPGLPSFTLSSGVSVRPLPDLMVAETQKIWPKHLVGEEIFDRIFSLNSQENPTDFLPLITPKTRTALLTLKSLIPTGEIKLSNNKLIISTLRSGPLSSRHSEIAQLVQTIVETMSEIVQEIYTRADQIDPTWVEQWSKEEEINKESLKHLPEPVPTAQAAPLSSPLPSENSAPQEASLPSEVSVDSKVL